MVRMMRLLLLEKLALTCCELSESFVNMLPELAPWVRNLQYNLKCLPIATEASKRIDFDGINYLTASHLI